MPAARFQLYSLPTTNGRKVSVALEELGLEYDAHRIDIMEGDQFTPEFIAVNPNSKIPAITDPDGPDGKPLHVMESGAILTYLARKTGKIMPSDPRLQSETEQWLHFQMGGIGPMFGQFGHFYKYAGEKCTHPYPEERYRTEVRRQLAVLDKRLEGTDYLVGNQYTIADIATFPWVGCIDWGYAAWDHIGVGEFKNVVAWHTRCDEKPASIRGANVCGED